MRLTDLRRKERGRIIGFEGGHGFQRNLETMGVRKGKVVETLAIQPLGGPIVIKVDNMTITIGRGMAMKVLVERL
ncbi:MAG: ferrous iron transport protein A [Candidatus Altiarchaeota archaeon]|nr:ferrous iron transport protein A [Candidatus Altiarchaeota archaeon]